jgi:hypothetical protein
MPAQIIDEFTGKPVSRERKRQLRRKKRGLCRNCKRKVATTVFCKEHAVENREIQRQKCGSVRRNKSLSYRL